METSIRAEGPPGDVATSSFDTPAPDRQMDAASEIASELSPEEESLQYAALAIPDSDAMSVSSLHTTSTDQLADEQDVVVADADMETRHERDWHHMLGLSGQSINAANTATSLGFAAARSTTAFSLALAKRITQGVVALPAMALDGAVMGNTPSPRNYDGSGSGTPTFAQMAHKTVGGIFDVISTLAVGGIDVGSAITGASLGAAATGVEGVRRALGSEVLRSLGAFNRLVKREWHSQSELLPPGGIPIYSVIGVTQATTAWVCIQMVTREYYEAKMLRHMQPIDLEELHRTIKAEEEEEKTRAEQVSKGDKGAMEETKEGKAHREDTPGASSTSVDRKQKKQVRILEEQILPEGEGDLIGAEIGQREDPIPTPEESSAIENAAIKDEEKRDSSPAKSHSNPQPLTNQEAIQGLKRYSKLVLGVYGGVALAWLGSLPPDLRRQAAGSVVDGQAPTVNQSGSSRSDPLLSQSGRRSAAIDDETDFLRAAASLDIDDAELIEDEAQEDDGVLVEASGTPSPSGMPGGFGGNTRNVTQGAKSSNAAGASNSEVLFSADGQSNAPATTQVASASASGQQGSSYSYLDLISGQADADLFHRLGGLEEGAALEGSYDEVGSQAGSSAQRLRRMQHKVARPSQPRYYVVTDHANKKIILVLRGSLTLGDIAIDLTCESANFQVNDGSNDNAAPTVTEFDDDEGPEPALDFSPEAIKEREEKAIEEAKAKASQPQSRPHERSEYIVHEGMYETAKEIGEVGRPVHRAVRKALLSNPGYNIDIAGHSLGAGVSALLALMWASPDTCLTVASSGLPVGRRVHAFCFAVPCVTGDKLGKRAEKLITSYCHSYDLVCRLSLGAILDIRNACAWLAYENSQSAASGDLPAGTARSDNAGDAASTAPTLSHPIRLINIMQRAFQHQSGSFDSNPANKKELEADFLALRKTLEANMRHVELYPPGVVLYTLPKGDLSPSLVDGASKSLTPRGDYLFRLHDDANRDEVFGQIIFERGMLSKHMPDIYHHALDAIRSVIVRGKSNATLMYYLSSSVR